MSETGLLIHPLRGLNDVFMTKASIVRRWSVLLGFAFVCLLSRHTLGADKSPKQTGPTLESFLAKLGYTAIPLKRGQHNDLRVTAHLAGKEKEFLVDTGWSLTTLDTPLGRKFKTARERGVELKDTVLGVLDDSETVLIDELKLGAARFLDQPARVRPLSASGESAFADGVLGCDFLLRHFCLIDCAELRLYVRSEHLSREGKVAFEASLNQSGWHGAPLDRTSALVRTCKANIEGNEVVLTIDTGSEHTIVHSKAAMRCHLRLFQTNRKMAGVGAIGSAWVYSTRPKLFEIDGAEMPLHGLYLGVTDMGGWKIAAEGTALENVDGTLGADLLAANHGLIDFAGRMLWFQPGNRERSQPGPNDQVVTGSGQSSK